MSTFLSLAGDGSCTDESKEFTNDKKDRSFDDKRHVCFLDHIICVYTTYNELL